MEGAFAWIGAIFNWFGMWIPRILIVDTIHKAVKFVWGRNAVPLEPGWYLWWPVSTTVTVYPTARQACTLPPQTISTADDRTVIVGGVFVYEIIDILTAVATTYEPEETAKTIVLAAVHEVCIKYTWKELQEKVQDGSLGKEMKSEAYNELKKYGIRTISLTLTDLAPARVIKLINTYATDKV